MERKREPQCEEKPQDIGLPPEKEAEELGSKKLPGSSQKGPKSENLQGIKAKELEKRCKGLEESNVSLGKEL